MSSAWWTTLGAAFIGGAVAIGLAYCAVGCAAAKPSAEAAYLAEQLRCIDSASTRSEADICRSAVKAKWKDGGGQ